MESVPPTRELGSKVIDYVLVSEGLLPHITSIGILSQDAVFASDHRVFFMDLDAASYFGHETDAMPAKQLRQLQLDDTRIADEYRKQPHRLFTGHNVYMRIKTIVERSKTGEWSIEDEGEYEKIDRYITRSMLSAAKKCGNQSRKCTPWSPALGMATQSIQYWDVRIKREGNRTPLDLVLNFYLSKSDVDRDAHDKPLPMQECIKQLNFSRHKLKDVVANAKEHRGKYDVEIAEAIVEKRNSRFKDGEIFDPVEKEILVEKEVNTRENRRTAQRPWQKMGLKIRGYLKPNTLKWSRLVHIEVPNEDGMTWTKVEDKEEVEHHLIDRNVAQFSHAGTTPFIYMELEKERGHTCDNNMADNILNGTLEHACMDNEAIRAIVGQLKRYPTIQGILSPILTTADFQSCFKYITEKKASSYSGRSVPHHKACADGSNDGLAVTLAKIHAAMESIPLETGFCPERWRQAMYVVIEKIPGIARTNKLMIIQLLKAYLNQILRAAFARNVTKLAQNNTGVISDHQYGP
jgi:hypothetical protein